MSVGVVLSGGGPLAVAWECGVASGLASRGIHLAAASRILGTSAGAIVGAQLASGRDPLAMSQAIIDERDGALPPGASTSNNQAAVAKLPELLAKAQSGGAGRAEVGAYALQAAIVEDEATYVARVQLILSLPGWPERSLGIVAVDAGSGAPVVFDPRSDATVEQAVAASCSLPGLSPPVSVAGRRYMDGGMRSGLNADLMTGCAAVLLICFTPPEPAAGRILSRLQAQVDLLTSHGARVMLISPDEACLTEIGPGLMDVRRRPSVAEAGHLQGAAAAAAVRAFTAELTH